MLLQSFRNTTFVRFFWGFMALYFLNICVDASDIQHNSIAEDLALNEQESIIEIVVEKVFDLGDVIEEQDDEDPEDYSKKGISKLDLSFLKLDFSTQISGIFSTSKNNFTVCKSFFSEPHYQLEKPPPEV